MSLMVRRRGAVRLLASDDFSELDGTVVAGKAADTGQVWSGHGMSGWSVIGGKAAPPAPNGIQETQVVVNVGAPDVVVEADITLGSGAAAAALCGRHVDVNNWIDLLLQRNGSTDQIVLEKRVAGTYSTLAVAGGAGLVAGSTYAVKLRMVGTTLEGYVNGVLRVSASDSTGLTNTRHGFRTFRGNGTEDGDSRWDNFRVTRV